jgi:hypothetical protein
LSPLLARRPDERDGVLKSVPSKSLNVLQPGRVSMHLHAAGPWTAAILAQLPAARFAANTGEPADFAAQGAAQSVLLAFYLALEHVQAITRGAPWIDTELMDRSQIEDYHRRARAFRDTIMHLAEKADRPWDRQVARQRAKIATRIPPPTLAVPVGYVSLGLYFESGLAIVWAPPGPRGQERRRDQLSWDEIEAGTLRMQEWVAAVLGDWETHKAAYERLVHEHNELALQDPARD